MAEAAQREDEERFDRVVSLLMRTGTDIIQGLFDHFHPPPNLAHALQNQYYATLKKFKDEKKILTVDEWNTIFPSATTCGESKDFDLTLLFKLLRNICNLTAPSNGWDRLPNISDLSLEADLARIKYPRNKTYHSGVRNMKLSEDEFNDRWEELSQALLRILSHYDRDPESIKEWERKIEDIRSGPSTSLAEDMERWLRHFPTLTIKCSYIKDFMRNAATLLFDQFKDDIQQLFVAVQDVIAQSQGIIVRNIYNGSIKIQLCVKDLSDLEDLWRRYNNGQLKSELEKVLIVGDIKKLGKDVELEITMSEKEYLSANSFFKELFPPHKGKSVEIKEVKEVTERLKELSLDLIHGDTIVDRGSHFQAHFAEVTSKDQIDKVVDHFRNIQEYTDATFVWASRLYDTDKDKFVGNSYDGDEIYLAGMRLQLLLEKIKVKDIVVIATCWQGEEYLDLDIYKNINERVLSLLMRHGLIESKTPEELAVSLEKFEAYFEKRKHKIAHAAYEAMKQAQLQETQSSEFDFIHSEVITDRKSKFQAHLAKVTSKEQVEQALAQLKTDSKIAKATYNMVAYRIYVKEKKTFLEEGRDDGENAAGRRLLQLLQISNVVDAVVIVTRWHGGVHIGPDRFKHINECANEVIKIATEQEMIATTVVESSELSGTKKKSKGKGKK